MATTAKLPPELLSEEGKKGHPSLVAAIGANGNTLVASTSRYANAHWIVLLDANLVPIRTGSIEGKNLSAQFYVRSVVALRDGRFLFVTVGHGVGALYFVDPNTLDITPCTKCIAELEVRAPRPLYDLSHSGLEASRPIGVFLVNAGARPRIVIGSGTYGTMVSFESTWSFDEATTPWATEIVRELAERKIPSIQFGSRGAAPLGGDGLVVSGLNLSGLGSQNHYFVRLDSEGSLTHVVVDTTWKRGAQNKAHLVMATDDERGVVWVHSGESLAALDASLKTVGFVDDDSPQAREFLHSYRLIAGDSRGGLLWLALRKDALLFTNKDDVDPTKLGPSLDALTGGASKKTVALSSTSTGGVPNDNEQAGAALLASIHADPSDTAARLVYADWLLDRNDPRGELIRAQLEGGKNPNAWRRARALIKAHEKTWLGPIRELTLADSRVFEGGFLARCAFSQRFDALQASLGHEGWTLVHTMTGATDARSNVVLSIVTQPHMRWLRHLSPVSLEVARALFSHKVPLPIERLKINLVIDGRHLRLEGPDRNVPRGTFPMALSEADIGLPNLRRLDLDYPTQAPITACAWLLKTELAKRLEVFGVEASPDSLGQWRTELGQSAPKNIREFCLEGFGWELSMRRDERDVWATVTARPVENATILGADAVVPIERALASLPPDALTHITVYDAPKEAAARLDVAARRQIHLVGLELARSAKAII